MKFHRYIRVCELYFISSKIKIFQSVAFVYLLFMLYFIYKGKGFKLVWYILTFKLKVI